MKNLNTERINKKNYNYKIGDKILIRKESIKKLESLFNGPFEILRFTSKNKFILCLKEIKFKS